MTLYPWAYHNRLERTIDEIEFELKRRNYHPEFLRRFLPWLESKGGHIGVGGHWRPNPSDTSAASRAGHSFHQNQQYRDGWFGPTAIDLVARTETGVWRSPRWDETPQSGTAESKQWGLHTFITGEPWHIQPIEIRGWWSWTLKLRPAPKENYPIPGEWVPRPPDPTPETETEAIVNQLPTLVQGAVGDDVKRVQALLNTHGARLQEDGHFGPNTHNTVKFFQGSNGLTVDGIVGRKETWPALLGVS